MPDELYFGVQPRTPGAAMPNPTGVQLNKAGLARLERERLKAQLSVKGLAELCGVAQPTMNNVFHGYKNPSPELMDSICAPGARLGAACRPPQTQEIAARIAFHPRFSVRQRVSCTF